ncbi:MAG: hypothetical protein Q4C20_01525 [Erysipelotrichaceae bacterium]|nr:hypothetical protein [Erysipelotrichaceae bacterium]
MIDKDRRDKLLALITQTETVIDHIDSDQKELLSAVMIIQTINQDIRTACRISEQSEALLLEKAERIRRMYDGE